MINEKYTPKDALERAKLLMSYDTKKTLTENKETFTINEQSSCPNSMDLNEFNDEMEELMNTLRKMDYAFVRMGYGRERAENVFDIIKRLNEKNVSIKTSNECKNALVYAKDKFKTFDKSGRFISSAKTLEVTLKELINGYYNNEPDALEYLEPALKLVQSAGTSVTPPPPPTPQPNQRQQNINNMWCSVKNGVIVVPGSSQNGKKWSDFATEFSVTGSELDLAKASCPKNEEDKNKDGDKKRIKTRTKYNSCPETFPIKQTCKNNKIKEIQACLNMPSKYQTGNFGTITQGYLERAGVSGTEITQDSYNKVCGKTTEEKPDWTDAETEDIASTNTGGSPTASTDGASSNTDEMS
jgi:hypothetical protein